MANSSCIFAYNVFMRAMEQSRKGGQIFSNKIYRIVQIQRRNKK